MIDFMAACGARLIDPEIALENTNVKRYIQMGMDEMVLKVLDEEF
jgi:hypothetical protein